MDIQIKTSGFEELQRLISGISNAEWNTTTLNDLSDIVTTSIINNITNGKDLKGNSVAPLSASTIKRKGNSTPLIDSGNLKNSILKRINGQIPEVYVGGSAAEYATYLQLGTSRMPKREFFGMSDVANVEVDTYLQKRTLEQLFNLK